MKTLNILENKYNFSDQNTSPIQRFNALFKRYLNNKKTAIIDTVVIATGLSVDIIRNSENELGLEALKQTNPNFNPEYLDEYSDMELQGIINSSKGKYFELLVVEKLNNGEAVGNIILPEGYNASLAESLTQPGWDMVITDAAGNSVDYFQMKATENFDYISQTLDKYPDIKIITTEEVIGYDERVIGTDFSDAELTDEINKVLESESDTFLDDLAESFNPLLPLCYIVATQGYKVATKKATYEQAINNGKTRVEKSLIISTLGAFAYASGTGWLSLPFTLGASALLEESKKYKELNYTFEKSIPQLQVFNDYRQNKLIRNGIF